MPEQPAKPKDWTETPKGYVAFAAAFTVLTVSLFLSMLYLMSSLNDVKATLEFRHYVGFAIFLSSASSLLFLLGPKPKS